MVIQFYVLEIPWSSRSPAVSGWDYTEAITNYTRVIFKYDVTCGLDSCGSEYSQRRTLANKGSIKSGELLEQWLLKDSVLWS